MRSTSAQIPVTLHHRFSSHIADLQRQPQGDDGRPTRLRFLSEALLSLPEDPQKLASMLSEDEPTLTLRAKSNPGIKRALQMTDEAYQRLLDLNATCVQEAIPVSKSLLIGLALLRALPSK